MKRTVQPLAFFVLLCGVLVSVAYGINYMYFTETEQTVFLDRIKFWHGDTLCGPVRSSELIAIMQDPIFCDYVISSAPDFWHGAAYNPRFLDEGAAIFNAPYLALPTHVNQFRQAAIEQGHYFYAGNSMQARVMFMDHNLRIWWAPEGQPFDPAAFADHSLPDSAIVYFDCPNVRISGYVYSILIFCAAGRIGFEDNVLYASSDRYTSRTVPGHPEKLALIAEGELKILNTPANGRENSGGAGWNQTNYDSTSIAINGLLFALNESFTFENQNDPDSGYVCSCLPDDRGTIYLTGSLIQKRRGYVHRATRNSTGYLKNYKYDEDLRHWNIGFWNLLENVLDRLSLDFGEVAVGDTAHDTVAVFNDFVPPKLDSIRVGAPFTCPIQRDTFAFIHHIPVEFIPTAAGQFSDTLRFYMPYYQKEFKVPVSGNSIINAADESFALHPSAFSLSAYPNPFNPQTILRFSLPERAQVKADVFDLAGRHVTSLLDGTLPPGEHSVTFDGSALSAGIYFARITSPLHQKTLKLLLVK